MPEPARNALLTGEDLLAKARQVLGNTNNLIALRVLDGETQKQVAEALPTVRLKSLVGSGPRAARPTRATRWCSPGASTSARWRSRARSLPRSSSASS